MSHDSPKRQLFAHHLRTYYISFMSINLDLIFIFAPMKNRLYAITLLLSFLTVLSHEMIPHHHHETLALNYSIGYKQDNHKHKLIQDRESHHHHDSENEEDNTEHHHPYPFHQHLSATNDVYIERTNLLESNTQIREISFFFVAEFFRLELFKPPEHKRKSYEEPLFLNPSLIYLKAFALRGPPSIV